MKCRAGDIVLLPFPFSDHSASKKRPVLVLVAPDERGDFSALAITSVPQHDKAFALSQVHLSEGRLPKPSWIRCAKVYTVNVSIIVGMFGALQTEAMQAVHLLFCDYFLCGEKPSR
jgi:mRNA interferase MazF